jgi:hypothetical protein
MARCHLLYMSAANRSLAAEAPAERLFTKCLFCGCGFPRNSLFNLVPPGERLAYDPERSRIWSICARCQRWNLIPIDDRYDAIDVLERAVSDRGHFLAGTANISWYQVDDISVIRIGPARLIERVSWRYGRELIKRGRSYERPRTRFVAATLGAFARLGEAFGAFELDRDWGPSGAADILRWQRFGSVAWTGRTPCPYCHSVLHTLYFGVSWWLRPRFDHGRLVVGVPCTRCDPWTPRNVFDVTGTSAQQLLRRALAYQHIAGASEREVTHATKLIERSGSAERLVLDLSDGRTSLWSLGPLRTLALEIAANHLSERRQLELRLHGIEAEWRIEEGLAAIIDDELS